jgi:hypothetical protein
MKNFTKYYHTHFALSSLTWIKYLLFILISFKTYSSGFGGPFGGGFGGSASNGKTLKLISIKNFISMNVNHLAAAQSQSFNSGGGFGGFGGSGKFFTNMKSKKCCWNFYYYSLHSR